MNQLNKAVYSSHRQRKWKATEHYTSQHQLTKEDYYQNCNTSMLHQICPAREPCRPSWATCQRQSATAVPISCRTAYHIHRVKNVRSAMMHQRIFHTATIDQIQMQTVLSVWTKKPYALYIWHISPERPSRGRVVSHISETACGAAVNTCNSISLYIDIMSMYINCISLYTDIMSLYITISRHCHHISLYITVYWHYVTVYQLYITVYWHYVTVYQLYITQYAIV